MKHQVGDRAEAARMAEEYGVGSVGDIRGADGSRRRKVPPGLVAERLALQAGGTPGGLSVEVDQLRQAAALADQIQADLAKLVSGLADLGGHQSDGWGPVSKRMTAAVDRRTDSDDGAVPAVMSYLSELATLRALLVGSADLYQQADQDGASAITKADRDV